MSKALGYHASLFVYNLLIYYLTECPISIDELELDCQFVM